MWGVKHPPTGYAIVLPTINKKEFTWVKCTKIIGDQYGSIVYEPNFGNITESQETADHASYLLAQGMSQTLSPSNWIWKV